MYVLCCRCVWSRDPFGGRRIAPIRDALVVDGVPLLVHRTKLRAFAIVPHRFVPWTRRAQVVLDFGGGAGAVIAVPFRLRGLDPLLVCGAVCRHHTCRPIPLRGSTGARRAHVIHSYRGRVEAARAISARHRSVVPYLVGGARFSRCHTLRPGPNTCWIHTRWCVLCPPLTGWVHICGGT